jgi:sugar/nucleoside kinase (ribokinase family)
MTELVALTNALIDLTFKVSEDELAFLDISKGGYRERTPLDSIRLKEIMSGKEITAVVGGSPANVCRNVAEMGISAAVLGSIGSDQYGGLFFQDLQRRQIDAYLDVNSGDSGLCYIMITPDGERTSITALEGCTTYKFNIGEVEKARIFHSSAYELEANPARFKDICAHFVSQGTSLSLDLASAACAERRRADIFDLIQYTKILFMTEEEAQALTGNDPLTALEQMLQLCPTVVLKKGSKGSIVANAQERHQISIVPVKVENTNGAGDAYASGFLTATLYGQGLRECGRMGSKVAAMVCGRKEPYLG